MLLELYFVFFKIGLFSIGGGLASIPYIQEYVIEQNGWLTSNELLNMIGVAESTPGPIGVNVATFVGYEINGLAGCLTAVAGLVTPSFIIMVIVGLTFAHLSEKKLVKASFYGIRPVVAGLIAAAGFTVAKTTFFNEGALSTLSYFNYPAIIFFIMAFWAIKKFDRHPIFYIVVGAILGIILMPLLQMSGATQ